MSGEAPAPQRHALAHAQFIGRLQRRISSDHNARAPTCQLRLLASLRGFVARSYSRSKAPRDRFVRLRARGLERRAVRNCAKSRIRVFSESRIDSHRHETQGAARLGGIRKWVLHSLLRL